MTHSSPLDPDMPLPKVVIVRDSLAHCGHVTGHRTWCRRRDS